ncbi:MAG TPA: hypothetical protein VFV17_05995 [Usitatibacteraceae bacterium]|nr:hypothetical protein [Usitatibacteraceae bacterium]
MGRKLTSPPSAPPQVKTLEVQKLDFTAEGAPPPGMVGPAAPQVDVPATQSAREQRSARHAGQVRPRLSRQSDVKLRRPGLPMTPASAVVTSAEPGALPSVPMQQAFKDTKQGLVDTDRGEEAGRTYRKLKR